MKQVTPVIPIVIALNNDPVGAGLIASRAYALFYAAAEHGCACAAHPVAANSVAGSGSVAHTVQFGGRSVRQPVYSYHEFILATQSVRELLRAV